VNRPFATKERSGAFHASHLGTFGADSRAVARTQAFAEGIEPGGFPRVYWLDNTDFNGGA
jgi:hypothetical protein